MIHFFSVLSNSLNFKNIKKEEEEETVFLYGGYIFIFITLDINAYYIIIIINEVFFTLEEEKGINLISV